MCSGILSTPVAIAWRESFSGGVGGWLRKRRRGCWVGSSTVPGPGGGQGWRDTQWETVLRLVANLITPGSLFRPPAVTPTHHWRQHFQNPSPALPLTSLSNSLPLTSHRPGELKQTEACAKLAAQPDEVLHCPAAAAAPLSHQTIEAPL